MKKTTLFWVLFGLTLIYALGVFLGILWAVVLMPHELAFIWGLIGFLLLGSRLISDYGWLAGLLEGLLAHKVSESEAVDQVRQRSPLLAVQELALHLLLLGKLRETEFFRYAYYGIFFLLLLVTVALQLIPEIGIILSTVTGLFWGAATAVFFVWVLDMGVQYLMDEYATQHA